MLTTEIWEEPINVNKARKGGSFYDVIISVRDARQKRACRNMTFSDNGY